MASTLTCVPAKTIGKVRGLRRSSPVPQGQWYEIAPDAGWEDGICQKLPAGRAGLAEVRFLTFDILMENKLFETFTIKTDNGTFFRYFSSLDQCQTRIVLPITASQLQGARCLILGPGRKQRLVSRVCVTPFVLQANEPTQLRKPVLPRGPIIDAMGLSRIHPRPDQTPDVATMVQRLRKLAKAAPRQKWPADFSRWGGWKRRRVKASGFFKTHHDGQRWWLVDPEGYLFWSSGTDCVDSSIDHETRIETRYMNLANAHSTLPPHQGVFKTCYRTNPWHAREDREFNYLEANFIRAFGPERWYENWTAVAHADLRSLGFNTAGDWSDEHAARRTGTPYARPLELFWRYENTPMAAGSMPDVFHPNLERDIAADAERALRSTVDDRAMLGYFLHNEPGWHMGGCGPAAAMLEQNPRCHSRTALARFLRQRYATSAALAKAWGMKATFGAIEEGLWKEEFTPAAREDLLEFSTVMLKKLCDTLSKACRKVDPNHLNLGLRWWTFPPLWVLKAMGSCDVMSFNYYLPKVEMVGYGEKQEAGVEEVVRKLDRPMMVGEWHFGSFDAGLPSAGLRALPNQVERAKAFRVYLENAAATPWLVGTHWFNFYDRPALYCELSNQNCNIGFMDITHHRHKPICDAARAAHQRLYRVAAGLLKPYDVPVQHTFPSC